MNKVKRKTAPKVPSSIRFSEDTTRRICEASVDMDLPAHAVTKLAVAKGLEILCPLKKNNFDFELSPRTMRRLEVAAEAAGVTPFELAKRYITEKVEKLSRRRIE